jgi:translation initiation factor 5B
MAIRQPLIVCVGHVDAGKTLLLDKIRGTAVGAGEVGGILKTLVAVTFH